MNRIAKLTTRGAIPNIDLSFRWSYRSSSYEASFLNRHRPGRNRCNFFFLIRRGGSQVRLRAGSQGYAGESCRRLEGRQGEGPRDVQQGRGRLQGPRPLCLLRERLRRRHDRASLPERRAPPEHRREEGLSPRKSDHGEGRGREDPKRDLLVASPGNQDAAREAHLLHEGRGPDLRGRILQAVGVRDVHALGFFAASVIIPTPALGTSTASSHASAGSRPRGRLAWDGTVSIEAEERGRVSTHINI